MSVWKTGEKTAESSAEVMAVWKTGEKTAESPAEVMAVWNTGEKTAEKRLLIKIVWKSVKIYSFSVWGAGIAPVDLTTLSSLRACRTLKTVVKRKFSTYRSDPFVTSDVLDAQNCGKTQISHFADRPFRHFGRVGRSKLW